MKDSRVTVWTNSTSHATGTTTNTGPTVDLFASGLPVGGTYDGTNDQYGIGVEIIQTNVSGTAQVTIWTWETSSDAFATVTNAGGYIGTITLSTASQAYKLKSNLSTRDRYVRLKGSNTLTGTSTSVAYAEDMGGFTGTRSPSAG